VKNLITICAATSPAQDFRWTGEAAGARRTVPPVYAVKGTGLPFASLGTPVGVVGMGADQLQGIGVDRARTATDPGIPPRWGPVRC
jgi:hypothetical protein